MSLSKTGTSRASGRPHQSFNQESLFFQRSASAAGTAAQRNWLCSGYGRQFFQVSLLCLMLLSVRGTSWCQAEGATLQGTVSDPTDSVIPHATISITNEATGAIRNSETNFAGVYSAQNLAAGSYRVVATATGFHERGITGLVLTVGAVRTVDITLSLAANTTQVEVTATSGYSAPAVETATSSVQGVVDDKTVRELPLNGRDWTSLAALQPGVSQIFNLSGDIATGSARTNRGLASQLTIGGNRPQQNNYRLDGISVNDYANGGPGSALGATLGVDAVQEFSVITSNAPAQYGRSSGGVINSITRSGTNSFHGSVYEFLRNSVFDARNFFDGPSVPSFRRNQFGGSIGGPIIRKKTFFFADYEGVRQSLGVSQIAIVPTGAARQGHLASGNVIVNPNVVPYFSLYALPNGAISGDIGQYNFVGQQVTNEDLITTHLDHNFSQNDTFRATALYDTSSSSSPDNLDELVLGAVSRRAAGILEETHVFSPHLANVVRFGYTRSAVGAPTTASVINPAAVNTALGFIPNSPPGQILITGISRFEGGPGGLGPFFYHYNSYQLYDDATFVHGQQTISFGGYVERIQNNALGGVLPFGEYSFGSLKSFLQNKATFYESALPATPRTPRDLRTTIAAFYVQDDWRVRENLTLNLGLRYEMATVPSETAGRLGVLKQLTDPQPTVVSGYFSNPTLHNFEPRVGFAWTPFRKGLTVFRGAFGVYDVLPLPYLFNLPAIGSAPFYLEGRNTTVPLGAFPTNGFAGKVPLTKQAYIQPNPGRNYVMQWTFNMQQQLSPSTVFTLGYIGSHGIHQPFNSNDMNIVLPTSKSPLGYLWPSPAGSGTVQNPAVGAVTGLLWVGSSTYHSMQAEFKYNLFKRLQGRVSYTWSKSIDDSSSSVAGATFSNSAANLPYFDMSLNKSLSDFDIRHVFSANYLYQIPAPGKPAWAWPLRGWTWGGIFSARTGLPFTVITGGDPLGTNSTSSFDYPDRVAGCGNLVHPQSVNYLNLSCFSFPTPSTRLGNNRRNSIIGPGLFDVDMALIKEITFTERWRIQFQAQAFNLLNRVNFAPPLTTQQQIFNGGGNLLPTAGQLTSTLTSPRQLQFSLKVLW
ncbi:MAG TPA: carboxypeptidase regulatory-like domain-containing protein [Terriglobales bacterium]|nr:carboxypeptidase regulatory-like domain-containing protein [Terriglobales bacterium]